jgi:thiol:disulfide interchange protein DsbC
MSKNHLFRAYAVVLATVFMLLAGQALADQAENSQAVHNIRKNLLMLIPVEPDQINKTPVTGLYEVMYGPRIVYVTEDGRFLVQGNIIDMQTRENITEPRLMKAKIDAVEAVGVDHMLTFSPPEGIAVKHRVNVFTDIDCGYCRKLHAEMADYNKQGIEIRYLFYPRAGRGSESYKKAVRVWCARDRHSAMDIAKAGNPVPDSNIDCENPVDDHMTLGAMVGVSGTPALVLDDGKLVPGYVPANRLIKMLDERK